MKEIIGFGADWNIPIDDSQFLFLLGLFTGFFIISILDIIFITQGGHINTKTTYIVSFIMIIVLGFFKYNQR